LEYAGSHAAAPFELPPGRHRTPSEEQDDKMARQKNNGPAASAEPRTETPLVDFVDRTSDALDRVASRIPSAWKTPLCMLMVLILGLIMYFAGRAEPTHAFWDENYHVTSAERYLAGVGQLEPHPPLGLMLIALGEKLSGANAGIDKTPLLADKYINGDKIPEGFSFAGMRLMPSLFGALGALLFLGLMIELTGSRLIGLLFSSLYLFENAWIVHFRAVHLDSFQMFFCIGTLWMFLRMWKQTSALSWRQYAGMALLCGLGIMIKVNAAMLLALFPVIYFKDAGTRGIGFSWTAQLRHFGIKAGASVATVLLVTATTFTLHAIVGTKPVPPGSSGNTDNEFMSQTYKDYLGQQQTLTPSTLLAISTDYFKFMDHDHKGVPKLDVCKPGENGSHPLHWPIQDKTINYRWDSANGFTRYVQLVGNQVSWYLGLAAVLLSFLTIANRRLFNIDTGNGRSYALIEVFTAIYVVFMLLHLYLGAQRVMYLYHYFIGLLISYLLIVLNWQNLCDFHKVRKSVRRLSALLIALAVLASGMFFLPLSNHWPLNKEQCERRNIFSHIVSCQG
jgi:dolichyl-phosphate-mannose-protein mannosyltransferase